VREGAVLDPVAETVEMDVFETVGEKAAFTDPTEPDPDA
jgi:hypothetical protein